MIAHQKNRLGSSGSLLMISLVAGLCLTGCDGPSRDDLGRELSSAQAALDGRTMAEAQCASCHSIGLEGESPHPDALPFRNFAENYPIAYLAEALAEGIFVGHPDMPVFRFEPDEVEALITYIELVQAPKKA